MEVVKKQLNPPESFDFGGNPGGFNFLNIPRDVAATLSRDQFFTTFNKPWLHEAISRNDIIAAATRPDFEIGRLYQLNANRKLELTTWGREYLEFRRSGYIYDPISRQMVRK